MELLVVIAIIGLLAAILFPSLTRAREGARRSACLSNLRQTGLAVLQYNQDFDEMYPHDADRILGRIYPYVKSAGVFKCPNDSNTNRLKLSYATNGNIFSALGFLVTRCTEPSKTVMMFEATGHSNDPAQRDGAGQPPPGLNGNCNFAGSSGCNLKGTAGTPSAYLSTGPLAGTCADTPTECIAVIQPRFARGRHFEGSNFLLADGHAKWYKGTNVSAGGSYDAKARHYAGNWWADGTQNMGPGMKITFSAF